MMTARITMTWILLLALLHAGDAWVSTNGMSTARDGHTATLLTSGRVLVVGGANRSSAELYDPEAHAWYGSAGLATTRSNHTATLLCDGRVLIAGGYIGAPTYGSTATCEIYDPRTGVWAPTGSLNQSRLRHVAVLLANGKVLAIGGNTSLQPEVFDPETGVWTPTMGATAAAHASGSTATTLPGGKVLIAGGWNGSAGLNICEVYDPDNGQFQAAGSMATARYNHTSTLLPSGSVLVTGGYGAGMIGSCELFNPSTNLWSGAASLVTARYGHSASLLANGKLMVQAGHGGPAGIQASCEIYDPGANTWAAGPSLARARERSHCATLLPDGNLLISGGYSGSGPTSACEISRSPDGSWNPLVTLPVGFGRVTQLLPSGKILFFTVNSGDVSVRDNAYVLDPVVGSWTSAGTMNILHAQATVVLGNNKVLAVGSYAFGPGRACDMYDPASNTWHAVAAMNQDRNVSNLVLLPSGKVLVIGGTDDQNSKDCELYDPGQDAWTPTGSLSVSRGSVSAILLPDGRVLAVGGNLSNGVLDPTSICEIFDPQTGAWGGTGTMSVARSSPGLAILRSGQVLAVGGGSDRRSCEIYDPRTGNWQLTGSRYDNSFSTNVQILRSGEVITANESCERYDEITRTWTQIAGPTTSRSDPTTWLLPNGTVVMVGGIGGSGYPERISESFRMPTDSSRRPIITTVSQGPNSITCTGRGFSVIGAPPTGTAWSSGCGDGVGSSSSNIPCVTWTQEASGRTWQLAVAGSFAADSLSAAIPSDAGGPGWLRIAVNGLASDTQYLNLLPPSVTLTTSAGVISENGGACTITATLGRAYLLPVDVNLSCSGGAGQEVDYHLANASIRIPAGMLSATTAITGIPDTEVEPGGESAVVDVGVVDNGRESGTQQVVVLITDYQSPGFVVGAISRHTNEAGQTATVTVRPSSPPLFDVNLNLASTDSTEGVVSAGASLVFTPGNWTTARTVTMTGVDDAIDDGNIGYQIIGSSTSGDPDYSNRAMPAITVINDDNDTAGIIIATPVGFITEGGGSAAVGVSLASQPTDSVALLVVSGTPAQGTVGSSSLTFSSANWNIPQNVTVTGADGDNLDNPSAGTNFNLTASVTAGPAEYPATISSSRTLTCYPSNAAPLIAAVGAQTVAEDSTTSTISLIGIGAGGGNEVQVLTITATSSDPTILPHPAVTYASPGAAATLALVPVVNATGVVTVTVRVTDDATIGRVAAKDAARSTEITFQVTVTGQNDAPVLIGSTATPWSQAEDDAAYAGVTIGAILGGLTVTDVDAAALRGLAITAAETANGSWQYNAGSGWLSIGTVSESAVLLLADDGITKLRFVPMPNYTGPAGLTLRAWDRSVGTTDATQTGGTTAFSLTTAAATVTVTPVNDAPVLATAAANPLTAITGGQANPGTPVAALIQDLVSDVDGDPQGIAITAISGTGGAGIWQYTSDSGTTWNPLTGAAPATARLLSDAGSTLVRYLPVANEAGTASLSFRAWDRSAGSAGGTGNAGTNGGTSAYSVVLATSSVTISSGNAAPVVSLPTSLLAYTENQPATQLDPAATVGDLDSANFDGGTMTVQTTLGASSADRLTIQPVGTVTVSGSTVSVSSVAVATLAGGSGSTPLTVAWNTNATPNRAQAVVQAISFANVSEDPSTAVRIVRVTTTDGDGAASFPVTVTVTIAAVNDQPVLAAIPTSPTYVEDAAPLILDPAMTVTDPDSPTFAGGTFSATLATGGETTDILSVRHQGNGSGQIGFSGGEINYAGTVFGTVSGGNGATTPLVVLLEANASQAAVQALMRNLTFRADSQHPSATTRTVSLRLSDGNGGTSAAEDLAIPILPVNDAPTATVSATAWQVNPSQMNSLPLSSLSIQDVDQPAPVSLVATITAVPAAGTIAVNGSPRTVGGTFTQRDLEQALVTYTAPASEGSYTLSFTIADGQASVATEFTLPIQVTSAISNIPPVVEMTGNPAWTEGLPPVQVDPAATVTDVDNDVLNAITATISNGSGQDVLSLREGNGVTLSSGRVLVDTVDVGTVSGGSSATPLRVTLNGAATKARVQKVVRSVSFAVADANPSITERTVEVKVNDGAGGEGSSTVPVNVIAVNTAPLVTLATNIAVNEDAGALAIDPAAQCSDVDSPDFAGGSVQVAVTSGGTEDQLAIADQGNSAGQIGVSGTNVSYSGGLIGIATGGANGTAMTITLSAAANDVAVRALLRALTYANSSQEPQLTRGLSIMVTDGDGGSTIRAVTVIVQEANDAPAVAVPDVPTAWIKGPTPALVFAGGSGVMVTDVDTPAFANGRLTIHLSSGASATDRLKTVTTSAITVAQDGTISSGATVIGSAIGGDTGTSPLIIALNAQATPSRVVDLLLAVAFDSTVDIPTTQDRTVSVVLEDGEGGISTQRTRVVTVQVLDDPPVIAMTGTPLAYTENDLATRVDPAASITDTIAAYAGSTLTIDVDASTADDRLAIGAFAGIELLGTEVRWNSLLIGAVQPAVRPSRIDILLNASAAPASVAALLQAVTYASGSDKPTPNRTVKIVFAVANFTIPVQASRTVAVSEINDAPAPNPVVLTTVGQAATGTWEAKDPDDTTFTWSIVSQPGNGTLALTEAGAWSLVPTGTGASSAVIQVVDARGLSSGDIVVPVVVSTATDAKPVVDSDPPFHVYADQTWSYDLSVSAASVASVPNLEIEAIGAPAGLSVAPVTAGSRSVRISWLTTGATPGNHVQFHLRISDRASYRTVLLPVVVYVRAPLAGGG